MVNIMFLDCIFTAGCLSLCMSLQMVNVEQVQTRKLQLTEEGTQVLQNGSHEAAVFNLVPVQGVLQCELMVSFCIECFTFWWCFHCDCGYCSFDLLVLFIVSMLI